MTRDNIKVLDNLENLNIIIHQYIYVVCLSLSSAFDFVAHVVI